METQIFVSEFLVLGNTCLSHRVDHNGFVTQNHSHHGQSMCTTALKVPELFTLTPHTSQQYASVVS